MFACFLGVMSRTLRTRSDAFAPTTDRPRSAASRAPPAVPPRSRPSWDLDGALPLARARRRREPRRRRVGLDDRRRRSAVVRVRERERARCDRRRRSARAGGPCAAAAELWLDALVGTRRRPDGRRVGRADRRAVRARPPAARRLGRIVGVRRGDAVRRGSAWSSELGGFVEIGRAHRAARCCCEPLTDPLTGRPDGT